MNTSDEQLNQLLNSVKPVPPGRDLAPRIIAQSKVETTQSSIQPRTKESNINKESLFKQILHSFIFPRPAYALACSMLLGILLGWQNADMTQLDNSFGIGSDIESALQTTSVEDDLSSLFLAEVNYYE